MPIPRYARYQRCYRHSGRGLNAASRAEKLRVVHLRGETDLFFDHADTQEEPKEFDDRIVSDTVVVGPGAIYVHGQTGSCSCG